MPMVNYSVRLLSNLGRVGVLVIDGWIAKRTYAHYGKSDLRIAFSASRRCALLLG